MSTSFPWFSGDIAKICKLILVTLGMPEYTHPKWQYQLLEDSDVYLRVKNFIIHLFLEILNFQRILRFEIWLADSSFWPIIGDLQFSQTCDCWWNVNNNISFHFGLFPRKANDKMFQKIQNSRIWVLFAQIWAKMAYWQTDRQWWFYRTLCRTGVQLWK